MKRTSTCPDVECVSIKNLSQSTHSAAGGIVIAGNDLACVLCSLLNTGQSSAAKNDRTVYWQDEGGSIPKKSIGERKGGSLEIQTINADLAGMNS